MRFAISCLVLFLSFFSLPATSAILDRGVCYDKVATWVQNNGGFFQTQVVGTVDYFMLTSIVEGTRTVTNTRYHRNWNLTGMVQDATETFTLGSCSSADITVYGAGAAGDYSGIHALLAALCIICGFGLGYVGGAVLIRG